MEYLKIANLQNGQIVKQKIANSTKVPYKLLKFAMFLWKFAKCANSYRNKK